MFPFTSETKKMGILLRFESEGQERYIYLVKGAEVVIEPKINPQSRITCSEACEEFATEGLRTLVFAQKVLTADEAQ
jgi:magnesium-transporting ATPase (P-type)